MFLVSRSGRVLVFPHEAFILWSRRVPAVSRTLQLESSTLQTSTEWAECARTFYIAPWWPHSSGLVSCKWKERDKNKSCVAHDFIIRHGVNLLDRVNSAKMHSSSLECWIFYYYFYYYFYITTWLCQCLECEWNGEDGTRIGWRLWKKRNGAIVGECPFVKWKCFCQIGSLWAGGKRVWLLALKRSPKQTDSRRPPM